MINKITIDEAIDNSKYIFIDVRSPSEYEEDSIPGAINLPVLSNHEREEVGTVYKQVGHEQAKELGLKYASKRLVTFYKETQNILKKGHEVVFYCFRGGLRSTSIATNMSLLGVNVCLLDGGYKSYRKYVATQLGNYVDRFEYIVLHGLTGVGKTKLLDTLKSKNYPVIDLESLAKNSGSVFGDIFFDGSSSTQKNFESKLLCNLKAIKKSYVFIESESRRIGNSILPDFIYEGIQNGKHILINTTMENRIANILEDYIVNKQVDNSIFITAIKKLSKKLGPTKTNKLIDLVDSYDYPRVIEMLMIDYYDPLYNYSIKKYTPYDLQIFYETLEEAINQLIYFTKEQLRI